MQQLAAYKLLDSGNGRKLEQVGPYILDRQASLALWKPKLSQSEWNKADGYYERSEKGGGSWRWNKKAIKDAWRTQVGPFELVTKATNFGHLGFFIEVFSEWLWFTQTMPKLAQKLGRQPKILNLFGYTGCSSLALAAGGAHVTHIDAAGGIVDWGKENQALNSGIIPKDSIRWIVEDCEVFVEREIKRGNFYDGVLLDPPSYGRGPKKQVFKIEESLLPLLEKIAVVLGPKPSLLHFTCHTPGWTPKVLEGLAESIFKLDGLSRDSGEMLIPVGLELNQKTSLEDFNKCSQSISSGSFVKYCL